MSFATIHAGRLIRMKSIYTTCKSMFGLDAAMAPTYKKVIPSLPVTSVPDAIRHYTEVLGFRVAGRDGDNHTWLQLANHEEDNKYEVPINVYLRRMYSTFLQIFD